MPKTRMFGAKKMRHGFKKKNYGRKVKKNPVPEDVPSTSTTLMNVEIDNLEQQEPEVPQKFENYIPLWHRKSKRTNLQPAVEVPPEEAVPSESQLVKPEETAKLEDTFDNSELPAEVESTANADVFVPKGRRVVDLDFFLKSLKEISSHGQLFGCTLKDLVLTHEVMKGLNSKLFFRCQICNTKKTMFTCNNEENELVAANAFINKEAVAGTMLSGNGNVEREASLNKRLFSNKNNPRKRKRNATVDSHYGNVEKPSDIPDKTVENMEIEKNSKVQFIEENCERRIEIAEDTRERSRKEKWLEIRRQMVIATNFGRICKSESNCSSKQYGTEDSSIAPSRHQDESRDFESSNNFDENDEKDDEDSIPETKRCRIEGQETALKDALQCIKTLLDESDKRDEHSIYGEHIAHKLRTSNRSNNDIAIAQHHIENIVFNLAMGVYGQQAADASDDKRNIVIPPIIASTVPDPFIIPKPEPSP